MRRNPMAKDDFIDQVDQFHREIEKFFHDFFHPNHPVHLLSGGKWRPVADIYETKDAVIIKMELPGVVQSEIAVAIEGDKLRVRGTREHLKDPGVTYHQMEINYGEFERTFVLPLSMSERNVKAEYREGFLFITVHRGV